MEDRIDKLFDLVEKMYIDLKGDIKGVKEDVKGLQEGQKKLQVTQEQMQTRLEQLAEIQQNQLEGQERTNAKILDKLERIEIATLENETEIYNIKKVK